MSRDQELMSTKTAGFPRVSGDEPIIVEHDVARAEFSPRERG